MNFTLTQFAVFFGSTLIHFTWIATLTGISVWIGLTLRTSIAAKANHRYRIGLLGMAALVLAIPVACLITMSAPPGNGILAEMNSNNRFSDAKIENDASVSAAQTNHDQSLENSTVAGPIPARNAGHVSMSRGESGAGWSRRLVAVSPWITLVYAIGLALMLARICVMFVGCHRILNRATIITDTGLDELLERHDRRLGLKILPSIASCHHVMSPVIVGIWKPVILLPASMLTGLTLREIEIVLCHELAHLRRHDPVVVHVQRIMETILFFHPAVWYISRSLDRDREICCDELVLSAGTSRIEYASVLCRVAELSQAGQPALSLAITGSSTTELVFRVGNILGRTQVRHNSNPVWRQAVFAISTVAAFAGMYFCSTVLMKGNSPAPSPSVAMQEPEPDKYAFDRQQFQNDREKGFSVVFKLLAQAESENAPPETVARLRYETANMLRFIELNRRENEPKDFSRAITVLRGVVTKPDTFLVNKNSSAWFRNCAGLLTTIYDEKGGSDAKIAEVISTVIRDIEAATTLNERERFLLVGSIRVSASDRALHAKDWPAAIEWCQPVIDATDECLTDEQGAGLLAMAVRQQSMFLANNGDDVKSAVLIDLTCEKLENAPDLDEATKISLQCMLRGKHLINFDRESNEAQIEAGWPRYQALRKRALAWQGPDRARVLRACIDDMDRLAVTSIKPEDAQQAIDLVHETMALIEAEPELQDPRFRVLWSLEDMTRNTIRLVQRAANQAEDPFVAEKPTVESAKNLKAGVAEFIAKYQTEGK